MLFLVAETEGGRYKLYKSLTNYFTLQFSVFPLDNGYFDTPFTKKLFKCCICDKQAFVYKHKMYFRSLRIKA